MDRLTPERRSWLMSRVRGKDTKPELIVRRLLHRLGYRYRLHVTSLPGKPDLVFSSRRVVGFVHGCFWHGHACPYGRTPKTNAPFWAAKVHRNMERDTANIGALEDAGWTVVVVWQCETKDLAALERRLVKQLGVVVTRRSTP